MIKVSLVVLHWKVFELYVNMNLSPKSRCQVKRRQVKKRVSTKLVTPKFYNIAPRSKAAKSTSGPLAKALLSQGRSSETRPLGNECAARRLGDLRTLLAIQSRRLPGLLLSSKGHLARRTKEQDICQHNSEHKKLETMERSTSAFNPDGQLLQRDQSFASSSLSGPVSANHISSSGREVEVASGLKSSLMDSKISSHSSSKCPSIAAEDKCDSNSSEPAEAFMNLLVKERENHQLVFSDGWSNQIQDSGSCHRPVAMFRSRSQQNVFVNFTNWK